MALLALLLILTALVLSFGMAGLGVVTSSVAAVTILPSATELATAWNEWSKASKKISRLRFIRRRIRELGYVPRGQRLDYSQRNATAGSKPQSTKAVPRFRESSNVFASDRRKEYTAEILGAGAHDDTNDDFWESLDLGPEQIAVYSMEMSKVSASVAIVVEFPAQ